MKAIVMAGGFAKRLWPLTREHAKPLISVGGRPVINYIVTELLKLKAAGEISEIIVSINAKFENDFKKWLDKYKFDIKLIVEPCCSEDEKLGAVGAINFIINKENIEEDLLVVNGDNLFDFHAFKFVDVIKFFREKGGPIVCGYDVLTKERAKFYGTIIYDQNNKVTDFIEKPEDPKTTLISTGCYLFKKDTLGILKKYIADGNPKDKPGEFLQWLHKRYDLFVFPFRGTWFDIGDHESLIRADEFARKELT
jgi:glucose-1-phosphate thymidylyltransferase